MSSAPAPAAHAEVRTPATASDGPPLAARTPTLAEVSPSFATFASAPALREIRARPASLWRRAGALLLDSAIVLGILSLYLGLAALLVRPAAVRGAHVEGLDGLMARLHMLHGVLLPSLVLGALLAVVYSSVFAFLWGGRSPGRWLFGIRLVDRRGVAPAPGHAIARALLALVSFSLCLAGFWLSLFDRRGQTLHDKLARTFVVRPG